MKRREILPPVTTDDALDYIESVILDNEQYPELYSEAFLSKKKNK